VGTVDESVTGSVNPFLEKAPVRAVLGRRRSDRDRPLHGPAACRSVPGGERRLSALGVASSARGYPARPRL